MEHFSIILALLRAALKEPSPAVLGHASRLLAALRKDGEDQQATQLAKLLEGGERSGRMQPSRVVLSRAALPGEAITPNVRPPVDKETGAPLADITLPAMLEMAQAPVLNSALRGSVDALVDEWRHLDRLRAMDIRPPLNCLLFGAPGTGKTKLAQIVSREIGLPLVTARLDGLISSYLGTTARNISALFTFANRYQCVLLLDEFDAIAKVRDDPHEVGEIKRVVNTLLQCLDQRSQLGITIAVTNHEQLLDSAIWRRFDIRVLVPKPDLESRLDIVNRYVMPLDLSQPERRFIAWLTEGLTGSEIETLANAIKRSSAMNPGGEFSAMEALKVHAMLSSNHHQHPRWKQLLGPIETLAAVLGTDRDLAFTQDDLASFFGKDQSTISRWKRKHREVS
ncbi:MAG: ATP-binding protein [Castellaniella sp.]|uniref:AAA family ATPase n=1 Tax=Castellaniella sp. TaxID=1955812 RepID=UPI00120FCC32|nr:AAA family ATPase [Castellaniella sp.]TAN29642.1 MAG: ATP-binding protein [Castellaniella sp.]